jgi:energy-converting hydrogenase Eha subunit E
MNLPTGSTPEANEILFQLTDGSDLKAIWRGIDSVHIIIIIFAGLVFWIIGKGRVFPLIFNINVLYAIVGMSISLLTSNRFLGLLMPWRACTYLYPISVIVLFTTALYYTNHLLDKVNLKLKYGIVLLSLLLFIVGANQYGIISPKKNFRYQRSDAGNYPFYTKVTEQTIPDEVILIPVDDHAFRLDAKRAVYVDGRNLPGWGEILIGWIERINFANSFYELEGSERQIACQDAGVDYYALYGIEPSEIETVVVRWKDKTLIKCPIDFSD